MTQRYLIALGSNRRHHRHGLPAKVLAAGVRALEDSGIAVDQVSPAINSTPIGPSRRRYANAVAIVSTRLPPDRLLASLKQIERGFGRRRAARWSARVLDLDIILWSGGIWRGGALRIPHPAYRQRTFVLAPAVPLAGSWRDPETGRTLRHHLAALTRPRPLP